jgi:hypothetical protein
MGKIADQLSVLVKSLGIGVGSQNRIMCAQAISDRCYNRIRNGVICWEISQVLKGFEVYRKAERQTPDIFSCPQDLRRRENGVELAGKWSFVLMLCKQNVLRGP